MKPQGIKTQWKSAVSFNLRRQICGKNCKKEIYYIIIDEVQYDITKKELENPEDVKLYNVLNGLMRLQNVDIYVTGSNSNLLSQDVMTAFRGRNVQVQVFPLSFKEYYDFVGGDKSKCMNCMLFMGEGMPQLLSFKRDEEKVKTFEKYKRFFQEDYYIKVECKTMDR